MKTDDIMSKQSENCSKVARQVVVTFTALSWLLVYTDMKSDKFNTFPAIALCICILYFILEIVQYYTSFNSIRKLEREALVLHDPDLTEEQKTIILRNYYLKLSKIDRKTYIIFFAKLTVIPIIAIILILYFIVPFFP